MVKIDDFFSSKNTVEDLSDKELSQVSDYLEPIKAFARMTYKSVYIVDYHLKSFEYVADNPLFLCGHTPKEVQEMGYDFYIKYVDDTDLQMLLKINQVGFDFYENIESSQRKDYTISYDYHLKNNEDKKILINQKLTPLFLTDEGKIWKSICVVSLSDGNESGNIKVYKNGCNKHYKYDLQQGKWEEADIVELTLREKEILQFSARGFTTTEIANATFISPETVKFHRRKLFDKLNVANIAEAIAYSTNNKLI